jgi:hypothetical protein
MLRQSLRWMRISSQDHERVVGITANEVDTAFSPADHDGAINNLGVRDSERPRQKSGTHPLHLRDDNR